MSTSNNDIWQYINPDLSIEPQLPQRPTKPSVVQLFDKQSIASLNVNERELYKLVFQDYRKELSQVSKIFDLIDRVRIYITNSVSLKNITYLEDTTTVYQMLLALKKRLAPTDEAKKI